MRAFSFSFGFLVLSRLCAEPGYVDPERCRPCHAAVADNFSKTGMGRSIQSGQAPAGSFYHRRSNRHYEISGNRMRRYQSDVSGMRINVIEKTIDLAIGSGNHAVTYAHRTPQERLLELPVSRYAADGGFYAMSPGYDSAQHPDMRREISDGCLFCHAAYPRTGQTQPEPIDCQRCHGPGEAHLAKPVRGTILNPAKLAPERKLEVCLQCHLETVSRGIVDSVRAPGREVFSYRPGEPLAAYKSYFDRTDPPENRFEINHAGYRLLQSACYRGSEGKLTCTTCHDPHTARTRNACAGCHPRSHAADHSKARDGCASCHMPRRRAQDAVHVVMTDHWIGLPADAGQLALRDESHTPYEGALKAFYTAMPPESDPLIRAESQRRAGDLEAAAATLRDGVRKSPSDERLYAPLGDALLRLNRPAEAIAVLRETGSPQERNILAVAYGILGEPARARKLLEQARASDPDHTLTWINLGVAYESLGRPEEAEAAYREAIRLQPDSSEARLRLLRLKPAPPP